LATKKSAIPGRTLWQTYKNRNDACSAWIQQMGDLMIREAAAELGLTYEEYLQLLDQKGLPVSSFEPDPAVLDDLRRRL
jgi:hypothetical protein